MKKSLFILSTILLLTFSLLTGCATAEDGIEPVIAAEEIDKASTEDIVDLTKEDTEKSPEPEKDIPSVEVEILEEKVEEKTSRPVSGTLTVEFLDVGQGDSILIVTPEGHSLLIDAGNKGDYSTISSRLESYGLNTVDVLIATHPHADHIGAMAEVVRNYTIGKIYMPDAQTTTKTFEDLLIAIDGKGYEINIAKAGVNISLEDDLSLAFVSPMGAESDLNNASAVLRLDYGESSFLFTGDMEKESEAKIIANIDVDVLKVGHHGSDTSSTNSFLKQVTPKIAIISLGAGNKYGHPHPDALSRLSEYCNEIYRTDESGTVVIKTDGKTYDIQGIKTQIIKEEPNKEIPKKEEPKKDTPVVTPPKEDKVESPPQENNQTEQVFTTKTGKKYHRDGCSSLSKSKIPISKEDAINSGLEPCKRCNP